MNNVYLTGMPGCGKSALGQRVAQELGMEFVDVDKVVLEMANEEDVNNIFRKQGVKEFRRLEKQALRELSKKDGLLVSTGGGAVLDNENVDVMINTGEVIFVEVSLEMLKKRIDTSSRPLVSDIGPALESLYFNRINTYKTTCTRNFNNDGELEEAVTAMVELIKSF